MEGWNESRPMVSALFESLQLEFQGVGRSSIPFSLIVCTIIANRSNFRLSLSSNVSIPFTEALSALAPAIMSHIGALRYQSLQFLASKAVERDSAQSSSVTVCLQAESVEITSTRAPERVLKTSKLGALTPVGQSAGSTELCTRWLIGELWGFT
jgi:hypothetical protein